MHTRCILKYNLNKTSQGCKNNQQSNKSGHAMWCLLELPISEQENPFCFTLDLSSSPFTHTTKAHCLHHIPETFLHEEQSLGPHEGSTQQTRSSLGSQIFGKLLRNEWQPCELCLQMLQRGSFRRATRRNGLGRLLFSDCRALGHILVFIKGLRLSVELGIENVGS